MTPQVNLDRARGSKLIKEKNYVARNELGQTFGTKKRKNIIKAAEMNQVRVSSLKDVAEKISETIKENATVIPLKADIDLQTMADRLIPPCNIEAISPADVYDVKDIISDEILHSIDVKFLWRARTLDECFNHLGNLEKVLMLVHLEMGEFVKSKITALVKEKKEKNELRKV